MRIDCVEIANFRKLKCVHIGLSSDKTVFVGANNSGKSSAMDALRSFLIESRRKNFSLNDFTLSNWPSINALGVEWEAAVASGATVPQVDFDNLLPFLDVWLSVEDTEVHYVQNILPTLDWEGGRLGVRLRPEPSEAAKFQQDYLSARSDVLKLIESINSDLKYSSNSNPIAASLWPKSLTQYLQRRLTAMFTVNAYILDPSKYKEPLHGIARPQALSIKSEPLGSDPFKGLIRIDKIEAQRGFGDEAEDDPNDEHSGALPNVRKLSEQLKQYYSRHLAPDKNPGREDIEALMAIEDAQSAFDARLKSGFEPAIKELEELGYPGVADPNITISTRLSPTDGLKHDAAVQYVLPVSTPNGTSSLSLPERSNGLGYQNLISMVFKLMSFRDAWMRLGKAQAKSDTHIPPLHLVLIEEPEAHLHTQVQQVFIRRAYEILRNKHTVLKSPGRLTTQLVVSTHSSHIAHECKFETLRYFRRIPAKDGRLPTSQVINLTGVFGADTDTERFVTRYLKVTHCDLFFADAAVLVEGPAERILVPLFVDHHCKHLSECYITWLEIGGSHAHRLRPLIEHLGLTTLIITDLDVVDPTGKKALPKRNAGLQSRNATLRTWCPGKEELDFLTGADAIKLQHYPEQQFNIRVAYQCPVNVTFNGEVTETIANTLEDALVFQNLELFAGLEGDHLIPKFKESIQQSTTIAELQKRIAEALKGDGKAELALDLLELKNPKELKPPQYIKDGLEWLLAELRECQADMGLAASSIQSEPAAEEGV